MTSRGIIRCSFSLICRNTAFYDASNNTFKSIVCYNQTRGKRYMRPDKDKPHPWLVPVKSKSKSKYITPENQEFLKEVVVDQYTASETDSPLKNGPWQRNEWTRDTIRTGVIGMKLGLIPQWKKDGTRVLCELIQVLDNHVIRYTPPKAIQKNSGFYPLWDKNVGSLVVGAMSCQPHELTKGYHNLFSEAGVPPKRKLTRFWVTPDAAVQPGTSLSAMHFKVGSYVNARAKTINRGFQGVMKRFGFGGGRASHGNTKSHRRPGSLSAGMQKGIHKGKKMPGIMGGVYRTAPSCKVWRINTKYNILYVTGAGVPGPTHGYVLLYDTNNTKYKKQEAPMPTFYPEDADGHLPEDIFDEELFNFNDKSISFPDEEK